MSATSISIIGLGWLGLPLAKQLVLEGFSVKGSTTSAEKAASLKQSGIEVYSFQLTPKPVGELTSLLQADTLIINVPPKAGKLGEDFHPAQVKSLVEAIKQSPIKHIIYVSSTSVYPELNRVVVEEDVTDSQQSAAPGLTRAEQLVQSLAPGRLVTVLRCGGLMGYERIPGKYIAGRTVDSGNVPVNYLHRDDAVHILMAIIRQRLSGTFNAVSPEHPTREAIYRKSCTDFGYELPTFVSPVEPVPYKEISVTKLLQETQYQFRFANPLAFFYSL